MAQQESPSRWPLAKVGEEVKQGYLDNAEATAAAFDERGWYRSGDLARVDKDGFLFIVDRLGVN